MVYVIILSSSQIPSIRDELEKMSKVLYILVVGTIVYPYIVLDLM